MNRTVRNSLFTALLVAALLVPSGPGLMADQGHDHGAAGMTTMHGQAMAHAGRELGTRQINQRYRFALTTEPDVPVAGKPVNLIVTITGSDGKPVSTITPSHGMDVHFFLIGATMEEFHHLHASQPSAGATGRYTVPAVFSSGGRFNLVAEFVDRGYTVRKTLPVKVDGPAQRGTRWNFSRTRGVGDLRATLLVNPFDPATRELAQYGLSLETAGGAPATGLQPYLDAGAHVVVFSAGGVIAGHQHSELVDGRPDPMLPFAHSFTEPGQYRLFVQFLRDGKLETVDFDMMVDLREESWKDD